MDVLRAFLMTLVLTLFATSAYVKGEGGTDNTSPLGFKFGISREEAVKTIESHGNEILEKTVDSKKIRTVVMEGAIVELPLDNAYTDLKTSLEFYDDALMSSSLIFKSDDLSKWGELEARLSEFLTNLYGEPGEKEEVLGFNTWTWHVPDLKVVLSTNPDNNAAKVQYIYEPVNQTRVEKEIEERQEGKPSDPAKEMFIDGNYSRPTELK